MKRALLMLALFGGGLLTSVKGSAMVTVAAPVQDADNVNWDWVYTLSVTTGTIAGNLIHSVEILDVGEFASAGAPNGWTAVAVDIGGGLTDVTFTRTGLGLLSSYDFTIVSNDNTSATGSFDIGKTGPDVTGPISVPTPAPEPASVFLLGGGLLGLGWFKRRRS